MHLRPTVDFVGRRWAHKPRRGEDGHPIVHQPPIRAFLSDDARGPVPALGGSRAEVVARPVVVDKLAWREVGGHRANSCNKGSAQLLVVGCLVKGSGGGFLQVELSPHLGLARKQAFVFCDRRALVHERAWDANVLSEHPLRRREALAVGQRVDSEGDGREGNANGISSCDFLLLEDAVGHVLDVLYAPFCQRVLPMRLRGGGLDGNTELVAHLDHGASEA